MPIISSSSADDANESLHTDKVIQKENVTVYKSLERKVLS